LCFIISFPEGRTLQNSRYTPFAFGCVNFHRFRFSVPQRAKPVIQISATQYKPFGPNGQQADGRTFGWVMEHVFSSKISAKLRNDLVHQILWFTSVPSFK
jgi:hypothetical protein